jgi:hypothetical protein
MIGRSVGLKLWWSVAASPNAIFGARFNAELRPNYIDENMSTARIRLRLLHIRHLLDRTLQLRFLLGSRYDRAYADPDIIKYDRLLPEAEVQARWRTGIPGLTAVVDGQLKYNGYINARGNSDNSFRPDWNDQALQDPTDPGNAAKLKSWEAEYYDYTRQDWEWEASAEAQYALWQGAILALLFKYHHRRSNMDEAPVPVYFDEDGQKILLKGPEYGYARYQLMLELRQRF